jgi:predicted RNA binding protein YcfA (HicA-like mRNA interferase family)
MTKLPSLRPEEVAKVLGERGYVLDRIRGSHHIYTHPHTKRKVIVPFHKKELPKGTLQEILKQAGLTKEELSKLL